MIPCKEIKCILLPICNSREDIECKDLANYLDRSKSTRLNWHEKKQALNTAWLEVMQTLPNVFKVVYKDPITRKVSGFNTRPFKTYQVLTNPFIDK